MTDKIALIPLCAAFGLVTLALLSLLRPSFTFWPPPSDASWQNRTFRVLFRIMFYGVICASIFYLTQTPISRARAMIGTLCLLIGGGLAFAATLDLGWKRAFGDNQGLRCDGLFRYSRNPIYITSWLGLAAWALLTPNILILITLGLWAFLYMIAIFLEERWLLANFGTKYADYRKQVGRFF